MIIIHVLMQVNPEREEQFPLKPRRCLQQLMRKKATSPMSCTSMPRKRMYILWLKPGAMQLL